MIEIITEIVQKIEAAQGFNLAAVGMIVVFSGLLCLLCFMQVLEKGMEHIEKKKEQNKQKDKTVVDAKSSATDENIDEVAAAIGLAFHFHISRMKRSEITLTRLDRSPWKEIHRSSSLERL